MSIAEGSTGGRVWAREAGLRGWLGAFCIQNACGVPRVVPGVQQASWVWNSGEKVTKSEDEDLGNLRYLKAQERMKSFTGGETGRRGVKPNLRESSASVMSEGAPHSQEDQGQSRGAERTSERPKAGELKDHSHGGVENVLNRWILAAGCR